MKYAFILILLLAGCSTEETTFSDELLINEFNFPKYKKIGSTENVGGELGLDYHSFYQVEYLDQESSIWVFGQHTTLPNGDNSTTSVYYSSDSGKFDLTYSISPGYPISFKIIESSGLLWIKENNQNKLLFSPDILTSNWHTLNTELPYNIIEVGLIDSRSIFYRDRKSIYVSEDQGISWHKIVAPGDENENITGSVHFNGVDNLFVPTKKFEVYKSDKLYKSEDKGVTWVVVVAENAFDGIPIQQIQFINSERGFLTLSLQSGGELTETLFESNDSGLSWYPVGRMKFGALGYFHMFDDGRGLFFNEYMVMYTRDYGRSLTHFMTRPKRDSGQRISGIKQLNDTLLIIPARNIYEFDFKKNERF